MKNSAFYGTNAIIFSTVLCVTSYPAAGMPSLEEIDQNLENRSLKKLATVQTGKPRDFTTDGCSGGLSDGWEYIAGISSAFREKFGDKPPWESCCVVHDKLYWMGETEDGYDKRKQADLALKSCVAETGKSLSEEMAKRSSLSTEQIEEAFEIAASLMYRAVRLGGKPCTLLPWRWGYGWPHCPLLLSKKGPPENQDLCE